MLMFGRLPGGIESTCYASNPKRNRALAAARGKYAANPEPKRAAARGRYSSNPEPKKAAARGRYSSNPEPKRAAARGRYASNPGSKKKSSKQTLCEVSVCYFTEATNPILFLYCA